MRVHICQHPQQHFLISILLIAFLVEAKLHDRFFFFFSLGCSYYNHEIKRRCLLLGRKAMTNLDSVLKSRDISLLTKAHIVKAMLFSSSHVWMWELDHKEYWRVERFPLRQWKASHGGHPHFKEKTFSKSANTFNNNHMRCLFFIWWHLPTLKWTGATRCTLTMDIMWLLILILIVLFLLFAPCICNCITRFVSSRMKASKLQMIVQTPATVATSSSYYLGPLDQISSIWGLGEYVASPI